MFRNDHKLFWCAPAPSRNTCFFSRRRFFGGFFTFRYFGARQWNNVRASHVEKNCAYLKKKMVYLYDWAIELYDFNWICIFFVEVNMEVKLLEETGGLMIWKRNWRKPADVSWQLFNSSPDKSVRLRMKSKSFSIHSHIIYPSCKIIYQLYNIFLYNPNRHVQNPYYIE